MPAYESDSSSDEGGDINTTNVTLGYVSSESTGDDISHVGGHPTWLSPDHTPPSLLAKCKVCSGYMSLLLLLNADLQQHFPNDERRLHVLCCRKKTCSKKIGSIRSFREVKKHSAVRKVAGNLNTTTAAPAITKPPQDLGSALFGSTQSVSSNNPNPFSTSTTSTVAANPFGSMVSSAFAAIPPQKPMEEPPTATFADKLKISSDAPENPTPPTTDPWPSQSSFPPSFPSFYLEAYPEELESDSSPEQGNPSASRSQYDADDNTSSNTLDEDNFESTLDKIFQKFSDRVAQNPEQVLRYEFKGQPLLYSGADGVASRFIVPHNKAGAVRGLPRCESCGAQRVFELQLVPGLIYELEKDEEAAASLDDGMEWGTIIVGTCLNNCGDAGSISFREEWVGVQWEERVSRK